MKLILYFLYKGIRNFNFFVLNFFYPRVTSIATLVLEKRRSAALLTPDLLKRSSINSSMFVVTFYSVNSVMISAKIPKYLCRDHLLSTWAWGFLRAAQSGNMIELASYTNFSIISLLCAVLKCLHGEDFGLITHIPPSRY